MKRYRTIQVEQHEISQVICDVCGREIKTDRFGYREDYLSVEKMWGYGSVHDGQTHCLDLCQDCYRKLLLDFTRKEG